MRFFSVVLFYILAISFVAATDTLPQCGLLCIVELTEKSSCTLANTTCSCTNAPLVADITECVASNCTVRNQLLTQKYTKDICKVKARDRSLIGALGIAFTAVVTLVFGLRMLLKFKASAGVLGLDDYILCVPAAFNIAFCILALLIAQHGLGKDLWNVPYENIEYVLHLYYWDELIYLLVVSLTKISILMFYLRIFPRPGFKYWVYALVAANLGYLISFEAISIFQCRPIAGAWKSWEKLEEYKCNNITLQGWMSAALNIVLDLGVLIAPLPELYGLNMSTKKKVQIMSMFCVGFFITIISCIRLSSLIKFGNTKNFTQDYTEMGIWSNIEMNVSIFCACMPALRAFFATILPTLFASTKAKSTSPSFSFPGVKSDGQKSANSRLSILNAFPERTLSKKQTRHDDDSFVPLKDLESMEHNRI